MKDYDYGLLWGGMFAMFMAVCLSHILESRCQKLNNVADCEMFISYKPTLTKEPTK